MTTLLFVNEKPMFSCTCKLHVTTEMKGKYKTVHQIHLCPEHDPWHREPATPIEQFLKQEAEDEIDYGETNCIRLAQRYVKTMEDSQVRVLLHKLAAYLEKLL